MQDLIKQEKFEIEVLDRLKTSRLLERLVFTGGTMLRLCFGLDRFSVDLDFWILKRINEKELFYNLKSYLEKFYELKDAKLKFYTLLFELKSSNYPRNLKIEIRRKPKDIKAKLAIAYSKYSNKQVMVKVVSLEDMMKFKIEAFLDRREIRDVFDIEFLLKRGIELDVNKDKLKRLLKGINSLTRRDYSVKLGSLLEKEQRVYYTQENFKILRLKINSKLSE